MYSTTEEFFASLPDSTLMRLASADPASLANPDAPRVAQRELAMRAGGVR